MENNPTLRNKVAKVTLLFWIMKIVATTLGETLGDYISITLNFGYLVGFGITLVIFLILLTIQLSSPSYSPLKYWLVIISTTTLGTEISDLLDRTFHFGYTLGSVLLFLGLITALLTWYYHYRTLAVFPIFSKRKELFFWIAVLFSNSLGTAFGDFITDVLNFSYLKGALITSTIILLVLILHFKSRINQIVLFWIAFIFTRPFGATFGDFLTKPILKGGLDLGTLNATLISLAIMSLLIMVSTRNKLQNS
jgi:uncharacterized membrane-anchored protein